MDALLAKLTNLSYEFFGILLPGGAAMLGILLLWIAAGDMVPTMTLDTLPHLTFECALTFAEQLLTRSIVIAFVTVISTAYFFGHLLTWIGRGGRAYDKVSSWIHLRDTLKLRPPKLNSTYNRALDRLYQSAKKRLLKAEADLNWTAFFPVAKMYLMQKASFSLVAGYQNKYTLHRALAVVAAVVAWGCLFILILGVIMHFGSSSIGPCWPGTLSLFAVALLAVWGVFFELPILLGVVGQLPHHRDLRSTSRRE